MANIKINNNWWKENDFFVNKKSINDKTKEKASKAAISAYFKNPKDFSSWVFLQYNISQNTFQKLPRSKQKEITNEFINDIRFFEEVYVPICESFEKYLERYNLTIEEYNHMPPPVQEVWKESYQEYTQNKKITV